MKKCNNNNQSSTWATGTYGDSRRDWDLGWVDYRGNGSFTVGIRSALLQGNHLRLYAGAGIVAGSNP
jgi:chorismate binding enzyme